MTFFYNLNKKLNSIESAPESKQLNERDMSRAAKGYEKYGKEGMEALAKAGREGKSLDPIRDKYNKYDEGVEEGMGDMARKVGGAVKKIGGAVLDKVGHGSDADMIRDLQKKMGVPQTGMKPGSEPNPKQIKEIGDTPAGLAAVQKVGRRADRAIGDAGTGYSGSELDNPDKTYAARDRANSIVGRERIRANDKNPTRVVGGPNHGNQMEEGGSPMTPKQKSFAKLAPPKDKITFADKIAGAKKEVDEMLGDVAAEAMKSALSGGQKKLDKNNNGKLDANDFAMLRKGAKKTTDEAEDNTAFTAHKRPRDNKPRVGDVEHGSKHDITHTATGRKVTRRTDDQGISVGSETDDEGNKQEKRGRGRPKGAAKGTERVTAKATKHKGEREKKGSSGSVSDSGKALQGFMIGNKPSKPVGKVSVSHKMKEGDTDPTDNDSGELKAAMALLKKAGYKVSKSEDGAEQVDEKAVSKKQQKFMGMVHATQKGEKAPSKEVAKVAKSMGKKDAEDFASTKHKGLPEKKKKEKTEEAGGSGTPTASSGFSYGKGIYDSLNRDLENAITESMGQLNESMSINMSDSTEGGKSLTITASDEDALKLATLLKSAGLGGGDSEGYGGAGYQSACGCGTPDCSCGDEEMDEAAPAVSDNEPDYPTNTEEGNALEYSGGLNGPKSTGQSTVPVLASQDDRQHSYAEAEEDAIKRMMEMAGIKEAKKVDEADVEEGNKFTAGLADDDIKVGEKIPGTNAVKKKDIDEGILASTRALWKKYQG